MQLTFFFSNGCENQVCPPYPKSWLRRLECKGLGILTSVFFSLKSLKVEKGKIPSNCSFFFQFQGNSFANTYIHSFFLISRYLGNLDWPHKWTESSVCIRKLLPNVVDHHLFCLGKTSVLQQRRELYYFASLVYLFFFSHILIVFSIDSILFLILFKERMCVLWILVLIFLSNLFIFLLGCS